MKNKKEIYFISIMVLALLLSSCCYFLSTIRNEEPAIEVNSSAENEKTAYLTFDDGPSKNTGKILEILDNYNIKATFFVVGPSYPLKDEYLKKIVSAGHELAIHSYEHNYNYIYSSKENYIKDFEKCATWIKSITGKEPKIYRFPGGSSNTIANKALIKEIINELNKKGYTHADWNVDTLDSYVKNDGNKIISNALTSLKQNENNNHYHQTILLHDDTNKPATIKALPSLIEKFIYHGYHFEKLLTNSKIIKHVN